MANKVLDEIAREEIRAAMTGLSNKQASAEAARLAANYDVSSDTIYAITKDLRPGRKARADRGARTASLTEDEGLRHAAELVADLHLAPYQALENARLNGHKVMVSETTFNRYLKELGISRKQRLRTRRPHRRFEEDAPGKRFHYDDSGLKKRWALDTRTRKILKISEAEVNDNHPNLNPNLVQVWSLVLVDDHSRRRFVRYVAKQHLTSADIGAFLLEGFREMGVPLVLYCDNAKPLRSQRIKRAVQLLDKAFETEGGFRIEHHAPLNSQASGKVEVAHKWAGEHHRLLAINDDAPTIESLNYFAANMCDRFNHKINSATGEAPMTRWQATRNVVRIAPPATLDAAFLAQEFIVTMRGDLTIKVQGETFQLPREGKLLDWASLSHKVTVILPHAAQWLVVIGQDGTEIICDKAAFKADNAGEYKAVADTAAQTLTKALRASRRAKVKANKKSGERFRVQLVDEPDQIVRPIQFPKPQVEIAPAKLVEVPGVAHLIAAQTLDYFDALDWVREQGAEVDTPLVAWLKSLFGDREQLDESALRAAWDTRNAEPVNNVISIERKLRLVS